MNISRTAISLGCLSLFLVGAGCSSPKTPEQPIEKPTTTLALVDSTVTPEQDVYLACEKKGYRIDVRKDYDQGTYTLVCMFPNGGECDAFAFHDGSCDASAASATKTNTQEKPSLLPTSISVLRRCTNTTNPVCGTNGKTYTNSCVAEILGAKVASEGACNNPVELPDAPVETNSRISNARNRNTNSNRETTSKQTEPIIPPGTAPRQESSDNFPEWLSVVISLLGQQTGSDRHGGIERCTIANQTYYYQDPDCRDCFSVLYNNEGNVICYPNNNLAGTCPEGFTTGSSRSCTKIWPR